MWHRRRSRLRRLHLRLRRLRLQAQGVTRLWQKLLLEMSLDLRTLLLEMNLDLRLRGRLIAIPGSRGHMTSGMQSGRERLSDDTLIAVSRPRVWGGKR